MGDRKIVVQDYKQPDFLLCEIPIKDGSFNDNRIWIYHRLSLSLIELVLVNNLSDFQFQGKQELFLYEDEEWFGVFVQNNCAVTDHNETIVLQDAWAFYERYLIWEDSHL
jgi:hypothetical protein